MLIAWKLFVMGICMFNGLVSMVVGVVAHDWLVRWRRAVTMTQRFCLGSGYVGRCAANTACLLKILLDCDVDR